MLLSFSTSRLSLLDGPNRPGAVLHIVADLLPFVGIFLLRWDGFVLLIQYWMETSVMAFWAIARVGEARVASPGMPAAPAPLALRGALIVFFTCHIGLFMSVHFLFLWFAFAGEWRDKIHGPSDFVHLLIIATAAWLPLLLRFIGAGAEFVFEFEQPGWLFQQLSRLHMAPARPSGGKQGAIFKLYGRIILMQLAILGGAAIALKVGGGMMPFIVLVIARTIFDLWSSSCAAAARAGEQARPQT